MIVFKRIRWQNFLMTGDMWTEIQLDQSPTTLIMGKNGSGKSTLLDALVYVLFGEPFRNITVPQLINDTNDKGMMVEVEFQIGRTNYKIRRGMRPRTFEIFKNNSIINQDANARDYQKYLEQNILKCNKKTIVQIVVLGSASFVPFMQLPPADRRTIIEDLLDIQIFSSMNQVLKTRVQEMKEEYLQLSNQIELQQEKVALVTAYLKKLKADNAAAIKLKKDTIADNEGQRSTYDAEILDLQNEIQDLEDRIKDLAKVKKRIKGLEQASDKLESNKSKANKELHFFEETSECPTCKQSIAEDFKNDMLTRKQELVVEIETALSKLQEDLKSSESRLEEINTVLKAVDERNQKIHKIKSSIHAIEKYIKTVQREIDDLRDSGGDSAEHESKLVKLEDSLREMVKTRDDLTSRKHYLDIVAVMLKDTGIKTKIIKQYLPIINKYVNKYLAAMDFFANFTLDENFKETIHIRGSKERIYYQLSEGQKLRIDLAVMFTWREIAKLRNSANTNLLLMDEIFESALDDNGIDDFLKLINALAKDVNMFVISPKGDVFTDKFQNTIKFVEERGFSIMEQ
jgi:DNA repair exonuclease SbcCD ATPase subunit